MTIPRDLNDERSPLPAGVPLSPAGEARRDAMRGELISAMRRTHAVRRARRVIVLNAVLIGAVAIGVVLINQRGHQSKPSPHGTEVAVERLHAPPGGQTPAAVITIVDTPANFIERYAVLAPSHRIDIITDEQLVDALAAANRPAGLVRTGDRVWLTREVADAPMAEDTGPDSSSS